MAKTMKIEKIVQKKKFFKIENKLPYVDPYALGSSKKLFSTL